MNIRHLSNGIIASFTLVLSLALFCSGSYAVAGEKASASNVKQFIRVPLTRQNADYTCGVTALQSILGYYGVDMRLDRLSAAVKPDPEIGTDYQNIARYAESLGFQVLVRTNMSLDELKGYIDEKKPVLLAIQAWTDSGYSVVQNEDGHYVVAIGYDDENFYFMDPSTLGHYTYIPTAEFASRWHDYDSYGKRVLIRLGLIMTKPDAPQYDPDSFSRLD